MKLTPALRAAAGEGLMAQRDRLLKTLEEVDALLRDLHPGRQAKPSADPATTKVNRRRARHLTAAQKKAKSEQMKAWWDKNRKPRKRARKVVPPQAEIEHKDGDPTNNDIPNLDIKP